MAISKSDMYNGTNSVVVEQSRSAMAVVNDISNGLRVKSLLGQ